MVDRLATLLERFSATAEVFNAGALCGINELTAEGGMGQLHLVRRGAVEVFHGTTSLQIDVPSLLFYPRPMSHRFVTDSQSGADMVCANVRFDGGSNTPLSAALPEVVCMPLTDIHGAAHVLELLFEEAFEQRCGRQVLVNRLFEVVLIQVLRCLMEGGQVKAGMLAGLSHPRLRNALVAMHDTPAKEWGLNELAREAGMSRSVFAGCFRDVLGITPGQYLQAWRIGLVQQALRQKRALKLIAHEVGYGSEAALSRAFKAQTGMSPRQWQAANRQQPVAQRPDLQALDM